jgi:hypothetical protein
MKAKDITRGLVKFVLPLFWVFIVDSKEGDVEKFPGHTPKKGWALQVFTRFITSIGPLVFAAWISVDGGNISASTQQFIQDPFSGNINWYVCTFWAALIVWTRSLYLRLDQEDKFETKYRATLMRTLYHLPDLSILWNYRQYHAIVNGISRRQSSYRCSNGNVDTEKVASDIRIILAVIAEMAQVFAKSEDEIYGANIMLVLNKKDTARVNPSVRDRVRFLGDQQSIDALDGLLVLPDDLAVKDTRSDSAEPTRDYPLIALPIRRGPPDLVLPGAPTAVLEGDLVSVHEDTRELADECQGFSRPVREEVRRYFSAEGEGSEIRSFAAIRLGGGEEPVGVINIDTDGTNVLGGEEEYYPTFWALLRPLLDLTIPLVTLYAEEYRRQVLET